MSRPDKLGIGVIGLHEGLTMLVAPDRPGFECPSVTVRGGCDLSAKKVEDAARKRPDVYLGTSVGELLRRTDVDIVAIYTPDSTHCDLIEQAFEHGKHVICTKPLINSIADAARLKGLLGHALTAGLRLLVGQSTRFFESFARQRRATEEGEVGALELVDTHYVHRMDWFYDKSPWAATDTDWVFLGMSHPLDLLVWYLGDIEEVSAYGSTGSLAKSYRSGSMDIYVVNVISKTGVPGRAMGHYGLHELPRARNAIELALYGSRGTSLAQYHDMRYLHTSDEGTEVVEDYLYAKRTQYFNDDVHGKHFGEFAAYAEHFGRSIVEGESHHPDGWEGLYTFCVMEAVRRSAREGRRLRPSEVADEIGLQFRPAPPAFATTAN